LVAIGTVDTDEWLMTDQQPADEHCDDGLDPHPAQRTEVAVDEMVERVRRWLFEGGSNAPQG
jgi:hypothetical protein